MSIVRMVHPDWSRPVPRTITIGRYFGTIFLTFISVSCAVRLVMGVARADF